MTCKEKLIADHPEWDEAKLAYVLNEECPDAHYDVSPITDGYGHVMCGGNNCVKCWDQEVPENDTKKEKKMTTKKTKSQLIEELEASENTVKDLKKQLKDLEQYKVYEDAGTEIKNIHTAFMNAGFTDDQAFELIRISMLTNIANNNAASTFNVNFSGLKKAVKG